MKRRTKVAYSETAMLDGLKTSSLCLLRVCVRRNSSHVRNLQFFIF